jgi:hypothetical protein
LLLITNQGAKKGALISDVGTFIFFYDDKISSLSSSSLVLDER